MTRMTRIKAIQTYFASEPHGRRVEMAEFKALTDEDRQELAVLCAAELGVELDA